MALGFRERKRRSGGRRTTTRRVGPMRARRQRTHVRGTGRRAPLGLGPEAAQEERRERQPGREREEEGAGLRGRREGRVGPEGGGEYGVGRKGKGRPKRERGMEKEREEGRTLGWAQPKGGRRV
uniref:Pr1-like protein n=2 Tax=Oryza sativa subsp. japonica TaxID=39947 RepID=Q69RW9_ORYSJ|nr:hypothetical protein [Oryza sativa Japonica Group]BAD31651.1 hypothetical protein [Oryza sativa Japonica Group]